jgi:hypothetical protein
MTTLARKVTCGVALAALLMFLGCSKTEESSNWLIGAWSFDGQMTTDNLPKEVKDGMGAMLVQQLMGQAGAGTLSFTATEATFKSPDGETKSRGYKILQRPDANTLVVESDDGEVSTFTRTGQHIAVESSGDLQFKAYFKRTQ